MKKAFLKPLLFAATFAMSTASWAVAARADAEAYAAPGYTNLREGPSTRYRVLARVRGGSYVYVYGCLYDLSWCEVNVSGIEGWMAASRLRFYQRGRWYEFHDRYRYHDIPIIEFRYRYRYRHRPPAPGPTVPPCPFPDPRECQPLAPGIQKPGGGGPDYPPNYKRGGGPDYPPNYKGGVVRRGDTVTPDCPPGEPGCLPLPPGSGTVPDLGRPVYPNN